MEKRNKIYEGKAKILYETDSPDYLIQYFKDDATAFNARKKGTIEHKGILNNKISTRIFEFLQAEGIPTHFEKNLNDREMLVKRVEIIPLEVVVRNVTAGSLCRNLGIEEGRTLADPILEFCFKDDELNDPVVNDYHIHTLQFASDEDVELMKGFAFKINALMQEFFLRFNITLIDFKLEFGHFKGATILADEISPDTCRLWEVGTGNKLDKDRFRRDLGNVEEAYQEVLDRITH